jgi:hypothetical protein
LGKPKRFVAYFKFKNRLVPINGLNQIKAIDKRKCKIQSTQAEPSSIGTYHSSEKKGKINSMRAEPMRASKFQGRNKDIAKISKSKSLRAKL